MSPSYRKFTCPVCHVPQRVTGLGLFMSHYPPAEWGAPAQDRCGGVGTPALPVPDGTGPSASYYFVVQALDASPAARLSGRMAPGRSTPILLVEVLEPRHGVPGFPPGETLRAELTEDLARRWDTALGLWTSWASTPSVQAGAGGRSASEAAPHLLARPQIPQIVDGRDTELHGLAGTLDRGLALHLAIEQKRRPRASIYVSLDQLAVHTVREGIHNWLGWVEQLRDSGLHS